MKWSWRIGRVFGIDLYLHATFLILVAYVLINSYLQRHDWLAALGSVLFIGLFFVIVVLHELGHCLTARRFGIETHDITLLPIGGLARLAKLPEKPTHELLIALAGPAVNWALFVPMYLVLREAESDVLAAGFRLSHSSLLVNLFVANAMMGLFNLLPAFPMDGGRVLRALLTYRLGFNRATEIAATIGQALAWGFGAIALFSNPWLLLIAFFVFLGAEAEADFVKTRSILERVRVDQVMVREFRVLRTQDPLSLAVRHVVAGFQADFPVVEDAQVVGVLTRQALVAGLAQRGDASQVGEFMTRDFQTIQADETAEAAHEKLQEATCRTLPVLLGRQLVGLFTNENVSEYVMIETARRGERPRRRLL